MYLYYEIKSSYLSTLSLWEFPLQRKIKEPFRLENASSLTEKFFVTILTKIFFVNFSYKIKVGTHKRCINYGNLICVFFQKDNLLSSVQVKFFLIINCKRHFIIGNFSSISLLLSRRLISCECTIIRIIRC